MPPKSDNGPTLAVRKSADGERYEVGVVFNGAFLGVASHTVASVEQAVQDAKNEAES